MTVARLLEPAASLAEALLTALDISKDQARDLLDLSGEELLAGYMKMFLDGGLTSVGIAPVVDGITSPLIRSSLAHPKCRAMYRF